MGQSATLYRIDQKDFSKVTDHPYDFELSEINKGHETFEKTFEGLQFVLSKNLEHENVALIGKIFYPSTHAGDEVDFSKVDFENLPDDFDFEKQPVGFNDPRTVSKINGLLNTISIVDFQNNFDPDELNEKDIYPGAIWNDSVDELTALT